MTTLKLPERALNKLISSAFACCCLCSAADADSVYKPRMKTIVGRIVDINHKSVEIDVGCSGNLRSIDWSYGMEVSHSEPECGGPEVLSVADDIGSSASSSRNYVAVRLTAFNGQSFATKGVTFYFHSTTPYMNVQFASNNNYCIRWSDIAEIKLIKAHTPTLITMPDHQAESFVQKIAIVCKKP